MDKAAILSYLHGSTGRPPGAQVPRRTWSQSSRNWISSSSDREWSKAYGGLEEAEQAAEGSAHQGNDQACNATALRVHGDHRPLVAQTLSLVQRRRQSYFPCAIALLLSAFSTMLSSQNSTPGFGPAAASLMLCKSAKMTRLATWRSYRAITWGFHVGRSWVPQGHVSRFERQKDGGSRPRCSSCRM